MNKRHILITGLFAFAIGAALQSCYYDNEEELYGGGTCDPAAWQYNARVRPIIENNCLPCHSQAQGSGGLVLEGFVNTRNSAVAGSLLCAIKHENGCSPMPQGTAKMSDCDITAIQTWVDNGAPEN